MRPQKILVFRIGALGDVIMTTPFLRQLRNNYRDSKIDYLIGKYASKTLLNNKNIDEIIEFDENIFYKKKIAKYFKLIKDIRKRKYDLIFVLDKHRIFNITAKLFGIKQRIGFDRNGEGVFLTKKVKFEGSKHEIHYYIDLLKESGLKYDYEDFKTEIHLSEEDINFAKEIFRQNKLTKNHTICIAAGGANNPGQKMILKLWPKENYSILVNNLLKKEYSIILIGDRNDISITEFIFKNNNNEKLFNLSGKTTINQTAALMSLSKVVITNDSGAMHIATSVNESIISIFGPTHRLRFAPLNKKSISLYEKINCSPCNTIFGNYKDCVHNKCMEKITPDKIINTIKIMKD